MSIKKVNGSPWTRVFVDQSHPLTEAGRLFGLEIRSGRTGTGAVPLRLMSAGADGARVEDVALVLDKDRIITIEPAGGASLLDEVETRLHSETNRTSPYAVCLALVEAGYAAAGRSLAMLEGDIRSVHALMADLSLDVETVRSVGVSDLPQISGYLTDIDKALSHASFAVARLTQVARLLRQEASPRSAIGGSRLDDLILQGQALARRLTYLVDRHQFHAQGAAQQICTSDLNVVKIFTVLWAILIPGTTLINWYGQNFTFMPALSWHYTSWVQLVGVFLLSALPIHIIKRSGQLR